MNAVEKFNDDVLAAIVAAIEYGQESTLTFSGALYDGACPYADFKLTVREKIGYSLVSSPCLWLPWWRDKVVTKCIWAKEQSSQFNPSPDEITVTIVPQDGGWYAEIKQHWYSPF